MRGITLYQPWASFMAMGLKKIETRHWSTSYRGPLLIHAAKRKPSKDDLRYYRDLLFDFGHPFGDIWNLPYGSLICKLNLIDCQQIGHDNGPYHGKLEFHLGNYDHGRWTWITDNLKTFDPIPYRGSQGFFNVPDELLIDGEGWR